MISFVMWLAWVCLLYSMPYSTSISIPRDLQGEGFDVIKRVFLSRGWGPGGYEVPLQGVSIYPEDALQLAGMLRRDAASLRGPNMISHITSSPRGSWLNEHQLKSPSKAFQEKQPKESHESRRFHSIFTSGTWSPLGKRNGISTPPHPMNDEIFLHKADTGENSFLQQLLLPSLSSVYPAPKTNRRLPE